jgi:hypothetical protein
MPVRNQNWYNLQSTRRYPLDDKTTGEDDTGVPIRDDIIVDCHIRYPSSVGQYLFVQGINVTQSLVTVVIGAADGLDDTDCPTVAVVTVEKPAARNVNERLTAFVPGLSGWIAFGPGIDTNFVGRYSTPRQTFIGLRNARPYTPLPVPSLGKDTVAEFLQGIVSIVAESPVTATYHENYTLPKYDPETEETNSLPVQAIVFSTEAPTAQFNPQTFFLAPCSQRPESGTCNKTPLERLNGVEPDCETGNINIVFRGGLNGLPFEECGGIDILTDLGLTEVCNRVPDSEKKRKDDCPCDNDDGVSEYCWPEAEGDLTEQDCTDPNFNSGAPSAENSDEFLVGFTCAELPLCVSFYDCPECDTGAEIQTNDFDIVAGSFRHTETVAPPVCSPPNEDNNNTLSNHDVWLSANTAGLNIALYGTCAGDWAYDKVVATELRLQGGGLKQNGGIVLNYIRVTEAGRCRAKYFAIFLDAGAAELQLYRFDGTLLIKENATPITHVAGTWYRVSAYATGTNGSATITATLQNALTGQVITTLVTTVNNYEIVNGRSGIIANAAATHFNKFEITTL